MAFGREMRPAFVLRVWLECAAGAGAGMGRHWRRCGRRRGRYGASATLGQVWCGGSKQEGQRRGMAGAGMGRHWRRCGGRRGRYGASVTLEQVWRGGSKQEGVQRRCLEREGGWWALHRQQLSFRSGVQSRLMFGMCGDGQNYFFFAGFFILCGGNGWLPAGKCRCRCGRVPFCR